jgi:flagellar motor component MotA
MSLRGKEFIKMRNRAMEALKKRYQQKQHELIDTLPEIAAKLKDTHMIAGR